MSSRLNLRKLPTFTPWIMPCRLWLLHSLPDNPSSIHFETSTTTLLPLDMYDPVVIRTSVPCAMMSEYIGRDVSIDRYHLRPCTAGISKEREEFSMFIIACISSPDPGSANVKARTLEFGSDHSGWSSSHPCQLTSFNPREDARPCKNSSLRSASCRARKAIISFTNRSNLQIV
jgi:hypothetical protein